jgi:hypothetical protein
MPAVLLDELLDEFVSLSERRIIPAELVMAVENKPKGFLVAAEELKFCIAHLFKPLRL